MAYAYVKELGMNENMTLISQQDSNVKTSDKYNYMLDREVQRLLKVNYTTDNMGNDYFQIENKYLN